MNQLDEILPPDTMSQIKSHISDLIRRRAALTARITELEAEGCIHGNIVDEYRNVQKYTQNGSYDGFGTSTTNNNKPNGPYYRLTFYTDPVTGIKPKPKYLGKNIERVRKVQKQIDNYAIRQDYQAEIEELDRVLSYARHQVERLNNYLDFHTKDYQQLVMPTHGDGSAGITKEEG